MTALDRALDSASGPAPVAGYWVSGGPQRVLDAAVLPDAGFVEAHMTITGWPGYAPTPLVDLAGWADCLGIGRLRYKDEGERFGLGSFKALGGAYAVERLVREARRCGAALPTVCCATDGNHGRAVAWGAQLAGCACTIFVHAGVSAARVAAIEAYAAYVVRVEGNYDDAVRRADESARGNGWTVVSDTSYEGYRDLPLQVMQGYRVLAQECVDALPAETPTHVFLQTGVGGFAAAMAVHFDRCWAARPPRFVLVEPERADCLLRSLQAGVSRTVIGELDTVMAGLACGEPSLVAWEILAVLAAAAVSIPDAAALRTMRALAGTVAYTAPPGSMTERNPSYQFDRPIVAGESGAAGLAGLVAVCADPGLREALALDATSSVLVIGTEADTDAGLYRRVVGVDAESIRDRR
ncbi:MAG: diaminopropionate ammonia-lyase [Proteobacteria bacterium]|nr:diaminopropionate ammonia-lyase [Burkholderiales bacterium]